MTSKGSDQPVRMRRLVRAFAGRTYHIVGNLMLHLICVCLRHAAMSVSGSLVVTCRERADLLALSFVMFSCVLSLSHMVS